VEEAKSGNVSRAQELENQDGVKGGGGGLQKGVFLDANYMRQGGKHGDRSFENAACCICPPSYPALVKKGVRAARNSCWEGRDIKKPSSKREHFIGQNCSSIGDVEERKTGMATRGSSKPGPWRGKKCLVKWE